MMNKTHLQVQMPQDERAVLAALAKAHRRSSSQLVRWLVEQEKQRMERENKPACLSHLNNASNADGAETR